MHKALRQRWVPISVGAWAVVCASVLWVLWTYSNVATAQEGPPVGWSPPPEIDRPNDRPTLILFAHPKCPCTRATMAAVERLQREAHAAFATRVVFFEPVDADPLWRRTDLWSRAGRLADAKSVADPGGVITAGAGVVVSGCVALLDPDGALLFWGGITPSRGHEGESIGLTAIRSILRGHEPGRHRAPIFGCDIIGVIDHSSECGGGGSCDASGNH